MDVQLKQPSLLTQLEIDRWNELRQFNNEFRSPYFHPQFTLDVGKVRNDVEVAVLSEQGNVVGFFPFQRCGQSGRPVGGMLNDAHGVLIAAGINWTWPELLKSCGLSDWNFHYLVGSQCREQRWNRQVTPAAVLNVAGGFDEYSKRIVSPRVIKQTKDRARKLEQRFGKIKTEWASTSVDAMRLLRHWKSQQYVRSGIADVFSFPWTTDLIDRVWSQTSPSFQGLLSVVSAGDRVISVHFGIRANDVLHMWFPAYDPELGKYSPGMIHILELVRNATDHEISQIDMGRVNHYKSRVATDYVDTAEGSVDLNPLKKFARDSYRQTFEWLRHSPLRPLLKAPGRVLRACEELRQFQ